MKRWLFRLGAALFLLYTLVGFILIPYLIERVLPQQASAILGAPVTLHSAGFNPYIFRLKLEGLTVQTPQGMPLLSLRSFGVNVDPIYLLKGQIAIRLVTLRRPKLTIAIDEKGRFNFDWLLHLNADANDTDAKPANAKTALPNIRLMAFELDEGGITFEDRSRGTPLAVTVDPVGFSIDDFRTVEGGENLLHFYARMNGDGVLDVKTRINSMAPIRLDGQVQYDAGKLYLAYHFLKQFSHLELAGGRLHADLHFETDLSQLEMTTIDDVNITLSQLRIMEQQDHKDVFRLGALQLDAGPILPMKSQATVSGITINDLYAYAMLRPDGTLNWQHYFPAKSEESVREEQEKAHDKNTTAAKVTVGPVAVHGARFVFDNATLRQHTETSVDDLNLLIAGLHTDLSKPVTLQSAFAINRQGRIEINATAVPQPLEANVSMAVHAFALPPFSPYVSEGLYAELARGRIDMTAQAHYRMFENKAVLHTQGDFSLEDLLLNDSRDTMPLLSMARLHALDYRFDLNPNSFYVDTVELDAFYANIEVDRNKTLNLASLARAKPDPQEIPEHNATAAPTTASPFPMRIVRFDVRNGAVHFADDSLPLPFETQIHDVNGEVLGISSIKTDTTYLRMDGEIDQYGVAKAEGSLNTGAPKTYTDIGVQFRNIDLSSASPYSGEFVGRAIDAGKLSVTLRYAISNGAMQGDNGLVVDKIALGENIENNSSMPLPLDFAIALLEDGDGVIDIDMPVEGNVDNPDFKWGGVVWDAFVNLITKAVSAPFDLIGSMLGIEGDELKFVPFEIGASTIDAVARERLDLLAKALLKRPRLGVTVRGTYDETADAHALKKAALIKEVLATAEAGQIDPQAAFAPALLEPVYVKRLGESALVSLKNGVDANVSDPAQRPRIYNETLASELIRTQPLDPKALLQLGDARMQAITTYLMTQHAIDAARITGEPSESSMAEEGFVACRLGLDAAQ